MLAEANREIQWQLGLGESRRRERARIDVPFAYVDYLLQELEAFHLEGWHELPPFFLQELFALNRLLPAGVTPVLDWPARIRDTIDRCFDLQGRLLALRHTPSPRRGSPPSRRRRASKKTLLPAGALLQ